PAVREGRDTVEIWGSGLPRREFLHVDDLADAVTFLLKSWSDEEPINIGTGTDFTIAELAELIAEIVGFKGRFVYDVSKPDGTPRKLLDIAKLTALGWCSRIGRRNRFVAAEVAIDLVGFAAHLSDRGADGIGAVAMRHMAHLRNASEAVGHQERAAAYGDQWQFASVGLHLIDRVLDFCPHN